MWLSLALAVACPVGRAAAQGTEASAEPPPRVIDLVLAAEPEQADRLDSSVSELLLGIDVLVRPRRVEQVDPREVVDPPPSPPPALARVWVELDETQATLYLADAPWERVLVRRVPMEAGLGEASREQLAQIIHTAVEALLAGARIGLSRAEAREELVDEPEPPPPEPPPEEPPAPPPPPPPRPGLRLSTDIGLGWSLQLWADGPKVRHAPLVHVHVAVGEATVRPYAAVGADLRWSQRTEAQLVDIELSGADVRFEAGVDADLAPGLTGSVGGGVTLDVASVRPQGREASPAVAGGESDVLTTMLSLRAGLRYRLLPHWWMGGGVVVDLDLIDTRYVVLEGGRERVVLDPWSIRPAPWLAAGYAF